MRRLVALIAGLAWVQQDGPGDPRLGAIGGSYGGGYQFLGAFESLRTKGKPVFDALAPEITWFDLNESLAPEGVVRTEWALALSAAALASDSLPPTSTRRWSRARPPAPGPTGRSPAPRTWSSFFAKNGPKWHVDHGRRLDIPVLFGQGTTDSLFNLQQGLANWSHALTAAARAGRASSSPTTAATCCRRCCRSASTSTSDPCSERLAGGTFADLALRFMNEKLKGRDTGLKRLRPLPPRHPRRHLHHGRLGRGRPRRTTSARSPRPRRRPRRWRSRSPRGRSGSPGRRTSPATLTALGINNRAFYGLGVGTTPPTPHLVQDNVLPINEPDPVAGRAAPDRAAVGGGRRTGGADAVRDRHRVSDAFAAMGSRTPGAVLIEDTVAHLPVVGR